ncbi:unnamed protein product [Calypogeia fissa]
MSSEFYTGWLTHLGEPLAKTDCGTVAAALERLLDLNASVVLYYVVKQSSGFISMQHNWVQFWSTGINLFG